MSLLSFFSSQGSAPASAPPAPTETAPVSEGVSGPGGPSGPGGGPCGSMSSAHSGGLDDQDSPQALDQWRMMVESGFITEHVQVQISKLLDLPRRFEGGRPVCYQIQASDDQRVLGSLPRLGGKAPAEQKKETVDLTEAEGTLNLKTSSVIILLDLKYDDGSLIASCSLSRMDPRSAKRNTYSFEDQHSSTPICGVELTIFEGQEIENPQASQASKASQNSLSMPSMPSASQRSQPPAPRAPLAPQSPPVGFPPGAGSTGSALPSKAPVLPAPSFSLGPSAQPAVPAPPPVDWRPSTGGQQSTAALGRELTIQVTQLLDMPSRHGQRYVVRVVDDVGQLAASKQVGDPSAPSSQTVAMNLEGMLPLRTESPFLTVRVEFTDGTLVGSCQIFRPDPRSQKSSRYLLTDVAGQSANCGIELQVLEGKASQAHAKMGSNLAPGVRVVGRLQLRVLGAFRLRPDASGAAPSAFVTATVGQSQHRTLTVESSRDPVWSTSNMFTFPVTAMDGELELKVVNSSVKSNEVIGALSLALWNVPSGQWLQRREKLLGCDGELEYAFLFEPAQVSTQVPGESTPVPAAPPVPPSLLQRPAQGHYGGLPAGWQVTTELPPGSLMVGDLMLPPLMAGWEATLAPRPALRSVPEPPKPNTSPRLEEHQMLFPDMFHFDRDDHPAEELWLKPPEHSEVDAFLGADRDFEVLARTAEKWRAPVLTPLHLEVFHDKVFPDMDVSLVQQPEKRKEVPVREVKTRRNERRTKGLPEMPVDGWMENKPNQSLKVKDQEERQPLRQLRDVKEEDQREECPKPKAKMVSPLMEARSKRREAKLKVERELVRPEQAKDIEQQLRSPEMVSLDPDLQPESFRAQVVSHMAQEELGKERRVWVRTPSEEPVVMEVPKDSQEWLEPFQSAEMHVGISSRQGKRGSMDPLPCQDCCSMTQFDKEVLYVVCDGHGPFGHWVAFRVAQSLPYAYEKSLAKEDALAQAFRDAALDLATYADAWLLDFSASGCTCSVILRQGPNVQIAWLGDSRALAANVTDRSQRVDFVTPAHNTEDVRELQRVRNTGAKLLQVPPSSGHVRIFTPGERTPGLYTTRSLGDSTGEALGILQKPEFRKMSFSRTSGLIVLGSGGLWEMLDNRSGPGLEALHLLREGRLRECGPSVAAGTLTEEVQLRWQQAAGGCCDDVSCIVLHWAEAPGSPVPRISAEEAAGPAVWQTGGSHTSLPLAALRHPGAGIQAEPTPPAPGKDPKEDRPECGTPPPKERLPCLACGTSNRPAARFCRRCGQRLAEEAAPRGAKAKAASAAERYAMAASKPVERMVTPQFAPVDPALGSTSTSHDAK